MIIIKDLFTILPNIILYIATGYAFVKTFHFVALKQNSSDVEHILLESIVIGYIYCQILFLIPIRFNQYINNVGAVVFAIIFGYLLGKFCTSKYIDRLLPFLQIRDSLNDYILDDLMDQQYAMRATIEYEDKIYSGYVHKYESYSNSPHIVLCLYKICDLNKKVLEDETKNITQTIILDTSTAKSVVIKYYKESEKCRRIKGFLK